MKVRVKFDFSGRTVDEVVSAPTAESLLAEAKSRVAKELGWKGLFLNPMGPIQFAQLAVKMYNDHFGASYPPPQTAEDFIKFGQQTGNIEVIEP